MEPLLPLGLNSTAMMIGIWIDETDEELPMVPTGTLAIASTRAKFSMHYGAVTIVSKEEEFSTIRGSRVPQSWVTKEPAQRFLQISQTTAYAWKL
ncbi:major capsid protein [Paenibacillus larvae]|nr:major capsid protein [Paenibacillus larvae]MDT2243126.1 major capsid protein [Paenibacillus larvae]